MNSKITSELKNEIKHDESTPQEQAVMDSKELPVIDQTKDYTEDTNPEFTETKAGLFIPKQNKNQKQALVEDTTSKNIFGGRLEHISNIVQESTTDIIAEGNNTAWQDGYQNKKVGEIKYKYPSFEESSVIKIKEKRQTKIIIPSEIINQEKLRYRSGYKKYVSDPDTLTGLEAICLQGSKQPSLLKFTEVDKIGNIPFQDSNNSYESYLANSLAPPAYKNT